MGKTTIEEGRGFKFADAVAAPPTIPTLGGGFDMAPFRSPTGGYARWHMLEFKKKTGAGDVVLGAPVTAYGRNSHGCFKLGALNKGAAITLADAAGHAEPVQFFGNYDAIEIVPATVTAASSYDAWITEAYEFGGK